MYNITNYRNITMDITSLNIMSIIKQSPKDQLIDNLKSAMHRYLKAATDIFGEGYFGRVTRPNYSPKMDVEVKDKTIKINTVLKQFKRPALNIELLTYNQESLNDSIKIFYENDKMQKDLSNIVIHSTMSGLIFDDHMMGEMIILMYISKLWYESITPHVPYLLTPLSQDSNEINALLLEMNGLPALYTYHKRLLDHNIYGRGGRYFSSHLENVFELLCFINNNYTYDEKNDIYLIPRLQFDIDKDKQLKIRDMTPTLDVVKLIDSIFLSFLITLHQLHTTLNLTLSDQKLDNVFLAFLEYDLHVGKRSLKNIKHIRYDMKSKSYTIPVYDIILKIGDVGSGVMKIRDDLILAGDICVQDCAGNDVHKIFFIDRLPTYLTFMIMMNNGLSIDIGSRLINYRILNSDKFKRVTLYEGVDLTFPTAIQLIEEYFKDYLTDDKSGDSDELFVVKI